jgi:hypothetical protein
VTGRPRYRLTLEAQPGDVPPAVRLRRGLKYLGRVFGLRCTSAEEVSHANPAPDSASGGGPGG